MTHGTFEDYIVHCAWTAPRRANLRAGQAYMNALDDMRPVLAQQVKNANLDPYYNDERIPMFLEFVMRNW